MTMEKNSRIFVAGHRGLVGSAICRELVRQGYANLLVRTHAELDLTNRAAVLEFFKREQPEFVFLAAAKVGGILANDTYPADFIRENLEIQISVIDACYCSGVKRLLFLGSSCIYRFLVGAKLRELEQAVKLATSEDEMRSEIARLTRQKLTSPS